MRVLYIGDRGAGGIANHVNCLAGCLPDGVERYAINVGGDEEFAGKNGHDLREWFQIRRVIKTFKPDVIHFHTCCILMAAYVKSLKVRKFESLTESLKVRKFESLKEGLKVRKFESLTESLKVRKFESLKVNSQTFKPSNSQTLKPSNPQTFKPSNPQTFKPSNPQTFKLCCSWHTPTVGKMNWKLRLFFWLLGKDCVYLPVSTPTWEGLKRWLPYAKGEVFFNPIRIGESLKVRKFESLKVNPQTLKPSNSQTFKPSNLQTFKPSNLQTLKPSNFQTLKLSNLQTFTVGMVGRNADQKDWPSFHKVEEKVKEKFRSLEVWRFGNKRVEFLNAGEKEVCDGRAAIAKMDLFVMTSKHEQLPTTVLECFALGTPICGFVPKGGMSDILSFSKGPLRDAFIVERDCDKLSEIVMDLLAHPEKRRALVEDGWQIVQHFDAEKNVRGQLMRVYEKV